MADAPDDFAHVEHEARVVLLAIALNCRDRLDDVLVLQKPERGLLVTVNACGALHHALALLVGLRSLHLPPCWRPLRSPPVGSFSVTEPSRTRK